MMACNTIVLRPGECSTACASMYDKLVAALRIPPRKIHPWYIPCPGPRNTVTKGKKAADDNCQANLHCCRLCPSRNTSASIS